jgi:hypothetical protein
MFDYGSNSVSDPGRTRTFNQLIKSQLLCQLSYRAMITNIIAVSM